MEHRSVRYGIYYALRALWINWAYGMGAIYALNVLAIFVSKRWLPLISLFFGVILYMTMRLKESSEKRPTCLRLVNVCTMTLIVSAGVMYVINILIKSEFIAAISMTPINPRIPYITILVLTVVGTIMSAISLYHGRQSSFCRDCIIMNGTAVDRGFVGKLYSQESDFQLRTMLTIMLMTGVGDYVYYYFFYSNISINSPDRMFYYYIPTFIYVLSLGVLAFRYISLWTYYDRSFVGGPVEQGRMTMVRFLVVSGDDIYLAFPHKDSLVAHAEDDKIDTPVKLNVSFRERITDNEALSYFKGVTGVAAPKVRFLYSADGNETGVNMYHFAVFVPDRSTIEAGRCKGRWVDLAELRHLSMQNKVSAQLVDEINRIHTITMAWKSYDRSGFRLYDIKNYRPAFRLRDFPTWDTDYNDPVWLLVADNNEDRPFFRLRRLWRKYVRGLGE